MSVTARSLILGAFELIQVFQPGEVPDSVQMQGALRRLNQMMGTWALQPLTIPVVAREVFALTANVGTYTIGPGGDFDTSRPSKLTGAGLLLNNDLTPVAITSITRSGSVATVTTTAPHGAATGQDATIAGASLPAYNGTFPVTVTGLSTFTYLVEGEPLSPAAGTLTVLFVSTEDGVLEIPRAVITDDAWQMIRIKTLTASQFTDVYYNPTFSAGLGTINLWPVPNIDTNALVLYRAMQLSQFSSLSAEYDLPNGYEDAIEYQLAKRLCAPFGVQLAPEVRELAAETFSAMKRANVKLADLPTDPALTHDPAGYYNILSGNL